MFSTPPDENWCTVPPPSDEQYERIKQASFRLCESMMKQREKDMAEILNEINNLAQEFEEDKASNREQMMETLKKELQVSSEKLKALQIKKEHLEAQVKMINKEMEDLESDIRYKWEPFLGADSATLALDGVVLSAKPTMNIAVEDTELMTNWFLHNGYESVMRYQIHNMTMKKIAKEELEKGTTIPGLKYTKFTLIKVK